MTSLPKRYSSQDFPPYAYVPGRNVHPNKPGGHQELTGEPKACAENAQELFDYGVDLFNAKYFWEAHVFFEALWNFEGRTSGQADFLKALIKLAAAALKDKMGSKEAAQGHIERALELVRLNSTPEYYRGLAKNDLLSIKSLDEFKFFLSERSN